MTSFIASKKSRQEFLPLVGKYIDLAHVEPLHLKNNAWQHYFKGVLKEAISKSKLPDTCKTFADVPVDSCFHRVITALRYELKFSCLARKVVKCYGETQRKGAELQYRFTGKESRIFCQNFMRAIKQLRCEDDSGKQRLAVLVYAYIGVRLRESVSLFSRIDITAEQLLELSKMSTVLQGKCFASSLYGHTNCLDTLACRPSACGTPVPEISPGPRYSDNGGERSKEYCPQETVREQFV